MPSYGDIIIVDRLADTNGVNAKSRPCVVVTTDEDLAAGGTFVVVAISTLLPGPTPHGAVAMRYDPRGHPRTGLKTRCAAFATWRVEVEPGRIARTIGRVPDGDMLRLARLIAEQEGRPPS